MSEDTIPVGTKVRIKDPRSVRFGEVCEVFAHDAYGYRLTEARGPTEDPFERLGGYQREQLEIVGATK